MRLLAALFVASVFSSLIACTDSSNGSGDLSQPPFSAKLIKTVNSTDLETRLKAELTRRYKRQYTGYLYGGPGVLGIAPGTGTTSGSDSPAPSGASGSSSYSETNVQEIGVDEGDLVKTDGSYLYLVRGTHFMILNATPAAQTAVVSDIDLGEPASELYLSGSNVTIVTISMPVYPVASGGSGTGGATGATTTSSSGTMTAAAQLRSGKISAQRFAYPYMFYQPATHVYCYDVTAPASPVRTALFSLPGNFQGSRRINSIVYLVTNFTIDLPSPVYPWDFLPSGSSYDPDAYNEASSKALEENLRMIDALTLDDMIPSTATTLYSGLSSSSTTTAPAVASADIYIPEFGNGTDLAIVASLDVSGATPALSASAAVLSSWCRLYMSPDNLYLASSNDWLWIEPVQALGMPAYEPDPKTAVHKFGVTGTTGQLLYRGSGVVDGWVNDRFSMSDYAEHLRIGTTRGGWWGENISNQLAILAEKDGQLVETGKITGIAPGENIYAMRYDRSRGYMVTFKQTDPLYTFDLSDPTNPRTAGTITVNGFATYLHTIGTDTAPRLLTIGRSADSTGRVTGNQLRLFDVSDLKAPALLDSYELGPGWSDALYDPHAFLYYEPLGILTIPYFAFGANYDSYSSGLNVFSIGPSSITSKGVISAHTITTGYGSYLDTVDRSVIIDNTIFAIAHRSATAADADTLTVIKEVDLPESYSYYYLGGVGTTGPGTTAASPVLTVSRPLPEAPYRSRP